MNPILEKHIKKYIQPSEEDISLFSSLVTFQTVTAKSFLLEPGNSSKNEFFVVKGCLKAYYLDSKGARHIIQFAIENWWVSDFEAFYKNTPSTLYIEAIEDSTLLTLSYENKEILFLKSPIFERYFRILLTNAFIGVRKRILSSLQKDATERYLEFCNVYPSIEHRVQNNHIANYLGISPESLCRIKRALKNNLTN
ncbi:Crp/Fnr family transcriptional regulator [Maribacter sp. CXY002]|uniref:Crp/Fnr family transcriptional regulator n=1 Tax=Maribacter luteocoastalis TaxID=3407671 RepID=UPI003B6861A4